jgi:integrase
VYLVRSGARWLFQRRPPSDLQKRLGKSPVRIAISARGAIDARRQAARLAVIADEFFEELRCSAVVTNGEHEGPDIFDRETEEPDCLDVLKARLSEAVKETSTATSPVYPDDPDPYWSSKSAQVAMWHLADAIQPIVNELLDWRERYGGEDTTIARSDVQEMMRQIAELREGVDSIRTTTNKIDKQTEKTSVQLLSMAVIDYCDNNRERLSRNGKESKFTKYQVPNAVAAFISFAGDKPVDQYQTSDYADFMALMLRVPANWTKFPIFDGLAIREVAEKNSHLKAPKARISKETVERNYMTALRACVEWACRNISLRPFEKVKYSAKRQRRGSEPDREPLNLAQVNKLFVAAVREGRRPEDIWLPILGFFTGARIGELAGIQNVDVKRLNERFSSDYLMSLDDKHRPPHDAWLLDITTDIDIDDKVYEREVKNEPSKRLIALHPILEQLGFVEWARAQNGPIFRALSKAQNPSDAASKRMARLFKKAEIKTDVAGRDVFHSLRHTTKDWLRDKGISERVNDRQTGHAIQGVGGNYGAKLLRPKEICELSDVPLPQYLDWSPYIELPGWAR